ncbi:MAG: hypothetical protein EBZ77_10395, partial [Chitinophagia bacterium]|nr:hypothetical protein [Chitinophagia bacterium]
EEPGSEKSTAWFDVITCNVRIVRDLNNINLEQEEKTDISSRPDEKQAATVAECLQLFHDIMAMVQRLHPGIKVEMVDLNQPQPHQFRLNHFQMVSLEKLRIELKTMKDDMELLVKSDHNN